MESIGTSGFSCEGKVIGGYYADVDSGCQMFHVCTLGSEGQLCCVLNFGFVTFTLALTGSAHFFFVGQVKSAISNSSAWRAQSLTKRPGYVTQFQLLNSSNSFCLLVPYIRLARLFDPDSRLALLPSSRPLLLFFFLLLTLHLRKEKKSKSYTI